jgi:uncharacterized protein (DUF1501 family)
VVLHPDRRLFVLAGLGGLAALARPLAARPRTATGRTLVLVQLTGGHDGLSLLVPYSDDGYARERDATRFREHELLRLDARVGLHPELTRLRPLLETGGLALVEGVGTPQPNRSHFRAMDTWHAADARGRGAGAGWIARALERAGETAPEAVVHLGARSPFALHSPARAPLCLTPRLLASADPERSRALDAARPLDVDTENEGANEGASEPDAPSDTLARVRARWHEARATTARLAAALSASEARRTPRAYPGSALARDLASAASLIHAELGVRVCSLELDGFDTHRDQRGRHARLMAELDGALAAFAADLAQSAAGRETLVVCFSEFGRRVAENASGGTDHGAAGLALVLGARVKGGLFGAPPSLARLDDGDLVATTDYRRLYATALAHTFALDPAQVLGPGFAPLELVTGG